MPRRSVVFRRLCCECAALATMPRNVTRSRDHSRHGDDATTVAARGELYSSASSPKDMFGVPSPNSASFTPFTMMSNVPRSTT
jgi:hypothetical protein